MGITRPRSKVRMKLTPKKQTTVEPLSYITFRRFCMCITGTRIDTKSLRKSRERETRRREGKWIVRSEENIFHIISACPILSPMIYLKSRHNQVAKITYQEKINLEKLIDPPEVTETADAEIWWDRKIRTVTKIEHNTADMIYWDKENKQCEIIETITCSKHIN